MYSIEVKNVSKTFNINNSNSIFDLITKKNQNIPINRNIEAIHDVSFNVQKGETFGIIGKNASGKTTLLSLISKIYRPNHGSIITHGKVVPLLGLGIGFQPEFSSKDNIIFYGMIMGFSKKEIMNRVENILKFAELERFSNTKTKYLSNGMLARLGFSTAIQVDPEILIVDEILAVGDLFFREKSYDAFLRFKKNNKTIVYVSHNLASIRDLCDRCMLLDNGKIKGVGEPSKIIAEYKSLNKNL